MLRRVQERWMERVQLHGQGSGNLSLVNSCRKKGGKHCKTTAATQALKSPWPSVTLQQAWKYLPRLLYILQRVLTFFPSTLCIYTMILLFTPIFNHRSSLILNISSLSQFLTEDGSKGIRTLKRRALPHRPNLSFLHREPCTCSKAFQDVTLDPKWILPDQLLLHPFLPQPWAFAAQKSSRDQCLLPGCQGKPSQHPSFTPHRHLTTKLDFHLCTLYDFCPTPPSFKIVWKKGLKGVKQRNH